MSCIIHSNKAQSNAIPRRLLSVQRIMKLSVFFTVTVSVLLCTEFLIKVHLL